MRTEHEIMSVYNQDLNARLKKYCDDNEPGTFAEYKRFFKEEADPYNMKSPGEAFNIYTDKLNDFLTKHNY
jgi:hypothetical protein